MDQAGPAADWCPRSGRDVAYDGAGVAVPGVQVGVRVVFGDAPHALPFAPEGRPARVFVPEAGAPRGVLGGGQAGHGVPALAWRARSKVEGPVPDTTAAGALICRAMSPELDPANHRAPLGEYRVAGGVAAPSPLQAMAAAGPADQHRAFAAGRAWLARSNRKVAVKASPQGELPGACEDTAGRARDARRTFCRVPSARVRVRRPAGHFTAHAEMGIFFSRISMRRLAYSLTVRWT